MLSLDQLSFRSGSASVRLLPLEAVYQCPGDRKKKKGEPREKPESEREGKSRVWQREGGREKGRGEDEKEM